MELLKTSAFVFQAVPFSENDKRVILLTHDFGRVTAIAPYAQKSKRRFGGALEPLTLLSVLYSQKQHSSLARLSEVSVVNIFSGLKKSIHKMAYGCYFLEVISEVMRENESAQNLFDFLHSFLKSLEKTKQEDLLARLFEARLLPHIGYEPMLTGCLKCKKKVELLPEKLLFSYGEGGVKCNECAASVILSQYGEESLKKVSKETILYVNRMMTKQKIDVTMATHLRHEMKALLPSFLFHHLGREMNSYRFIETLIAE
ncbi:MAG: DNA repair protein RecO [Deltaproteobacteria bacterium GWA2_38_16]|nr:MAG: DNA repair protein RecO [Deltaproteobacteria bacterium GWA2_38_16]OGQ01958.1 MAG: DNA repair protein RecO [Deltaproteobacteria bacterium RIFCSPHIGHO2_02_FULL_38_15]OGQ34931.1 MAG: DNA repair protein RecO [Deltaproteobacteria bacterium RIFCSPLOWO2_01_FULL_38_9]HBQ21490.1 DNA repair protein RecO [Deltaproteobacteria bacterium]